MKSRWHIVHPATLFLLLVLFVVFLSWICDIYGWGVTHPVTGEEVGVKSLLQPEGIRWWLRHAVDNFTGFVPVGMALTAMLGVGLIRHSGFLDACIGVLLHRVHTPRLIVAGVVVTGLLSNVAGDAGYVLLLPVAAILFRTVGLNPVSGIVAAYVSVASGYSANLFVSTSDSQLSSITCEALEQGGYHADTVGVLGNWYFLSVSFLLLAVVITLMVCRTMLPYRECEAGQHPVAPLPFKHLSRREVRALRTSVVVGSCYALLVVLATFSPWSILRSAEGGLIHSPFMEGILLLLSFGLGLMGMTYGFVSGRYHTDGDVVEGLTSSVRLMGSYLVIAFFASQLLACLEYSCLDKCLLLSGAMLFSSVKGPVLCLLLLLILFTACANLLVVSSAVKWSWMACLFVPLFADRGIPADVVQCAYRIGDSATNAFTPWMMYLPLMLACVYHYDEHVSYTSLLRLVGRYTWAVLWCWTALFVLWYLCGLPWGF